MKIRMSPFLDLPLFRGMNRDQIFAVLESVSGSTRSFRKGETILFQGDAYEKLHVVIRGVCCADMVDLSGKIIRVEDLPSPYAVAVGVLFSNHNILPVSIKAKTDVEILTIKRESLLEWCSRSETFLRNFIEEISNKVTFLSQRLYYMSFRSIRSKLAHYLLGLSSQNKSKVRLHTTLEELSNYFGVSRPSLSRVLIQLEKENILKHEKSTILILNRESLMEFAQ